MWCESPPLTGDPGELLPVRAVQIDLVRPTAWFSLRQPYVFAVTSFCCCYWLFFCFLYPFPNHLCIVHHLNAIDATIILKTHVHFNRKSSAWRKRKEIINGLIAHKQEMKLKWRIYELNWIVSKIHLHAESLRTHKSTFIDPLRMDVTLNLPQ